MFEKEIDQLLDILVIQRQTEEKLNSLILMLTTIVPHLKIDKQSF